MLKLSWSVTIGSVDRSDAGWQAGDAARPPHAVDETAVAQIGVGGRDRRAAEAELRGEFALCRQAGAERDPAVEDEQPHAIGERRVGGTLREVTPADDESGQCAGRKGCHAATLGELVS